MRHLPIEVPFARVCSLAKRVRHVRHAESRLLVVLEGARQLITVVRTIERGVCVRLPAWASHIIPVDTIG